VARLKYGLPNGSWASDTNVRAIMRANRNRDSGPELAVRSAVHRLGLRFRVAARPLRTSRLTADLVFPKAKVAAFVDGCFWHGCQLHRLAPTSNTIYWTEKIARNRDRDARIDAALATEGWTVVRVWEHESADDAAHQIANAVLNALSGEAAARLTREALSGR
jgi:DNA mismatch endonuclease (patch repair protein)